MPSSDDLKMLQALPLDLKIEKSMARIREWVYHYGEDGVYVSFSGGKDSTVLLDLVRSEFPNVPAVFFDTGLEFPEIRDFVKSVPNVELVHPTRYNKKTRQYERVSFRDIIKDYGYPIISKPIAETVRLAKKNIADGNLDTFRVQRINGTLEMSPGRKSFYNCAQWKFLLDAPFDVSEKCCDLMKKNPAKQYTTRTGRVPFVATMAHESLTRKTTWLQYGCNAYDGRNPQSKPLSFWTEQDILAYIVEHNLPYATVYGDIVQDKNGEYTTTGCDRTGCVYCAFGVTQELRPNRFESLKETHPQLWDYCMRPMSTGGLGMQAVLDYIGVPSGAVKSEMMSD